MSPKINEDAKSKSLVRNQDPNVSRLEQKLAPHRLWSALPPGATTVTRPNGPLWTWDEALCCYPMLTAIFYTH